jgi:L-threonylcarbamoyladenylate synthase
MAVIESYPSAAPHAFFAGIARKVQSGEVIAVPTETYYGLAVNPFDAAAVGRLLAIKGRPDGKPILILIGDQGQLKNLVTAVPPVARVLMAAYWSGPLTLVLPAGAKLPAAVTAGPLTGTSANRSGEPPVQTAAAVERTLGTVVDVIVDGGTTPGGLASTVVDVCDGVRIIREGPIDRQMLQRTLEARGFHLKS